MEDVEEKKQEAYKEIAKTAHKALDISEKFGKFLDRVFGELLTDAVGIIGDRVKLYRLEKSYLLAENTQKKLEQQGVKLTIPVNPKVALPLIEAATIEDEESIQDKWENMLVNAMNPNYVGKIKRSFVSILEDMEPIDVLVLDVLAKESKASKSTSFEQLLFEKAKISNLLKVSSIQCDVSLRNLIRLGCLKPGVISSSGVFLGGNAASSYKDTELVGITSLGIEFHDAVNLK